MTNIGGIHDDDLYRKMDSKEDILCSYLENVSPEEDDVDDNKIEVQVDNIDSAQSTTT